jgi:hypothetical protein
MSTEVTVAIVSSILTAIVGPIAVHIVKERILKKKEIDHLKESLEINTLVANKLDELKETYDVDRIWLAQFHNGGNFYPTGKSIQKFSMVHEIVGVNIKSTQQSFQNIPISLFSKSINYLLEENTISIPDFKDETIATYGLKYIAEENGCKSTYLFAIKSIDDKFIGIIGIDYVKRKTSLSSDDINHILLEASTMGGFLMNKK